MSGDDSRVATAHLGELAVRQGRAAVGIRAATFLAAVDDVMSGALRAHTQAGQT